MKFRERAHRLARVERLRTKVLDAARRELGAATQREYVAEQAQAGAEMALWEHMMAVTKAVADLTPAMPAQAASHVGHLLRQEFAKNVEVCTRITADARSARVAAADGVRAAFYDVAPLQKIIDRYREQARIEGEQREQQMLDEFATQRTGGRPPTEVSSISTTARRSPA